MVECLMGNPLFHVVYLEYGQKLIFCAQDIFYLLLYHVKFISYLALTKISLGNDL